MNPYDIILHPLLTEKSMDRVDKNNELVFVVARSANKKAIEDAVEKIYKIKIARINTLIDKRGQKRAFIKLTKDYKAIDIMTKMGVL